MTRIRSRCPNGRSPVDIGAAQERRRERHGRCREQQRRTEMQYTLMLYVKEAGWTSLTPAQQQEGMAAYMAYTEALAKAGAFVSTNRLGPSAASTTLRMADGKQQVLDGPYA